MGVVRQHMTSWEIRLNPMKKAPTPTEKSKKATWQRNKRHQKLRLQNDQNFRLHNDCGPNKDGKLE